MSIEALSIVLNHSKAKGAAKVVLIGIANHLGPDAHEGAWPSQNRLASYANITDRAVRDAIDSLVKLGELRVQQAGGPSRSQYKPNRYWINLRCPESCDGTLGHNSRGENARVEEIVRAEEIDNQGGSFQQSGWKPTSYEPSEETIKKQHFSSRLPDDWQPKEKDVQLMREHFPSIDLKLETHAFRDYWRAVAGTKGKKADWDATWRNWIRNSYKRNKPNTDLSHLNLED